MRGTRLRPSSGFLDDANLFATYLLAERLGKTVAEMLTGTPQALSQQEFVMWVAFWKVKNYFEKKQAESGR